MSCRLKIEAIKAMTRGTCAVSLLPFRFNCVSALKKSEFSASAFGMSACWRSSDEKLTKAKPWTLFVSSYKFATWSFTSEFYSTVRRLITLIFAALLKDLMEQEDRCYYCKLLLKALKNMPGINTCIDVKFLIQLGQGLIYDCNTTVISFATTAVALRLHACFECAIYDENDATIVKPASIFQSADVGREDLGIA